MTALVDTFRPLGSELNEWNTHQREIAQNETEAAKLEVADSDEEEEFIYPSKFSNAESASIPAPLRSAEPSPAQLESLFAAASSGDLPLLQRLFKKASENGEVEAFALANCASTRTGFTALHAAASRGYHDIAVWRAHLFFLHSARLTWAYSDRGMRGNA